jgi:NDP-sugar pyrophosphorylase family protein
MKFAILAAGEGSRLSSEGAQTPKPLTMVKGEALIDRLLRIFDNNNADEMVVAVNTLTSLTLEHLKAHYNTILNDGPLHVCPQRPKIETPVRIVSKTTESSMHTFYGLSPYLGPDKFCLTTVDTIFKESEFAHYISMWQQADCDGLMAVTSYVDDEKPLYVNIAEDMRITGFLDTREDCSYISGGIYCLDSKAIATLGRCMAEGISRMRNFQRRMVTEGLNLKACAFGKIVDVDHVSDIAKAEELLDEDD